MATLMDVWVLDPRIWQSLNVVSWVPVDHEPAPDPVLGFFEESGAIPLAMSEFGRDKLAAVDPLYCPHGVDTKKYVQQDRAESREEMGFPEDCFLVGMVAANKGNSPSRKCFQEAIEAFKVLYQRHKDARLYLHTEATGRFNGVNIPHLIDAIGVPRSAVIIQDQYRAVHLPLKDELMAKLYSSFDVCLQASAGEGFGIPVIEAQACGCPVIVSDFSAQPELVGAGWTVGGGRMMTALGSWQFRPHVSEIAEALQAAYGMSEAGKQAAARKARKKALEYDADVVFTDYMLPALAEAQQRFEDRVPVEIPA